MSETIDIVIQGKYDDYTDKIVEEYLKIPFAKNIIVSCWEDNKQDNWNDERVIFVRNKYPSTPGTSNKNLQIVSSLEGLKKCTSNYSVKVRSDQKYSSNTMIKFYEYFIENYLDEVIFVNSIEDFLLFHPSDHMYWGSTKDMIYLFDIPLEYNSLIDKVRIGKWELNDYTEYFVRPETYIGAHYCTKFHPDVTKMLIQPEKYLYDRSENWNQALQVSNESVYKAFKPFEIPSECIEFAWPKYGIGDYN